MAESSELQALEKISTEVDESQIKVILATQCIKAQAFLFDKLKKQVKRNKETCANISSANSKLQSEITQAEQEIKSFHIAKETIRFANVELRREWLVAKEKKLDIMDRVENGENKYETLWQESKSRYESLPFVQNLLKATETAQSLKDQIKTLDKESETLEKDIQDKKKASEIADRKIIIELAEFIVRERPKMIENINEKSKEVTDLTNQLKNLNSDVKKNVAENEVTVEETETTPKTIDESEINESDFIMPKLQLVSLDIDDLISIQLDQVKMKTDDWEGLEKNESPYYDIGTSIFNRKTDIDETISSYFPEPIANEEKAQSYSRKKLINILEDVKIDDNDAMDIISKVNPDTLQPVESISAEAKTNENLGLSDEQTNKVPIQTQEIEDIEMASSDRQEIVEPPTQFLDETLKTQKSQELKKTVSFDLSITSQNVENTNKTDVPEENIEDESIKPVDVSAVSDDDFSKIKDMVLKEHNLDLTPPFVYAKNTVLKMKTEEKIVTSKFFRGNENIEDETKQTESAGQIQPDNLENKNTDPAKANTNKIIEEGVEDDMMVSSPKKPKIPYELCKIDKPFSGYLFNHGTQGLPDSLDVSINTTGYEDVDDFPHCIDSNLLLSPKSDLPMCDENQEVQSQEAPNFLSGLRKTGLSFFGRFPAKDTEPNTSTPNQGSSGFSFNFGGEEKKNRGGLFSMFQ